MPEVGTAAALEAAEFLRSHLKSRPRAAVVTGTGLGDITTGLVVEAELGYARIPHFPLSTVPSHHGRLIAGRLAGCPLVVLQGRFHLYEGYAPRQITFPIRVLQELGVQMIVLTNAAGGLNPVFQTGDIMIIQDHLNLTGANPLTGPNEDRWGPRFPDMTAVYDADLRRRAGDEALRRSFKVRTGVYAGLGGPSLETPAEMRYLRTLGADAVGFSTVMEAIAAAHAGMRVLGFSIITNMNLPDAPKPASVEAIIAAAQAAAPQMADLLTGILEEETGDTR